MTSAYANKYQSSVYKPPIRCLWFSRHQMTQEQRTALGPNIIVNHVALEEDQMDAIRALVAVHDMVCVVGSAYLRRRFVDMCPNKPVLIAKNDRVPTGRYNSNGEPEFVYKFVKWQVIESFDYKVVDYDPDFPLLSHRHGNISSKEEEKIDQEDIDLIFKDLSSTAYCEDHDNERIGNELTDVRKMKYFAKIKGRRMVNRITYQMKEKMEPDKFEEFKCMIEFEFNRFMSRLDNFDKFQLESNNSANAS